jgi:molybdenum cofactor synthesis domain-containing protein
MQNNRSSEQQRGKRRYLFAVITMSDKGARGEREDTSGEALKELLIDQGFELAHYSVIADDIRHIAETVIDAIEKDQADLVLTTGGTGVSPRDVTPEAMDQVFDKDVPGIAEAMRAASIKITPRAVISRSRAGIRGTSLIINLPGSKKAALENISVILPALIHAIEKIKGSTKDCAF